MDVENPLQYFFFGPIIRGHVDYKDTDAIDPEKEHIYVTTETGQAKEFTFQTGKSEIIRHGDILCIRQRQLGPLKTQIWRVYRCGT